MRLRFDDGMLPPLKMKERPTSKEMQEIQCQKLEKARKQILPYSLQKEAALADTLTLLNNGSFGISHLQNVKTTNLSHF